MIVPYVRDLREVDETQAAVVGGKGAHLGGLSRIEGVRVPDGFCVTTDAFRRIMAEVPSIDDRLDQLSRVNPDDREAIRTLSAQIRRSIEGIAGRHPGHGLHRPQLVTAVRRNRGPGDGGGRADDPWRGREYGL